MSKNNAAKPGIASPKERGTRVRHIRETLLRYSREKFGKKYDIPANSIQNWEVGKYGGLTEKGATKLIRGFNAEGIACSVEWLLYGIGSGPGGPPSPILTSSGKINPHDTVTQELQLFHQLHPNAIDAIMADNAMEPILLEGDLVAGIRYFAEDIQKLVGKTCIVQLAAGNVVVRNLHASKKNGLYTLISPNPRIAKIENVAVFSAAPIIWIRRSMIF